MYKNKGFVIVFGFFAGIALCILCFTLFPIYLELLLAVVAIFAIVKIADYLKLKATVSEDKGLESDELRERLTAVERRLTEVQDVMIALSEKIDHMDGSGSKPWERQEPREQG